VVEHLTLCECMEIFVKVTLRYKHPIMLLYFKLHFTIAPCKDLNLLGIQESIYEARSFICFVLFYMGLVSWHLDLQCKSS
jgi:hypothetical protein